MRKIYIFLLSGVLMLSFIGCGRANKNTETSLVQTSKSNVNAETSKSEKQVYLINHLIDKDSQSQIDQIFQKADISKKRREVFWNHVNQINTCKGFKDLKKGYKEQTATEQEYDPYALQDSWNEAHPDFVGYNCRITAFSLMGDYITMKDTSKYNDQNLFMDLEALNEDNSACIADNDLERFKTLYSTYSTENTKDINTHLKVVQRAWKKAGITFRKNSYMSLISIFFHDQFSEKENELMIGHTGVLFDMGKDGLFFVEKLAFQEPYDVVKFSSRQELSDYIMEKYDVDQNQPTARPFIMENDQLINTNET